MFVSFYTLSPPPVLGYSLPIKICNIKSYYQTVGLCSNESAGPTRGFLPDPRRCSYQQLIAYKTDYPRLRAVMTPELNESFRKKFGPAGASAQEITVLSFLECGSVQKVHFLHTAGNR